MWHELRPPRRRGPESACLTLREKEDSRADRPRSAVEWLHEHLRAQRPAKGALIKVERGVWMAYEYPNFQGQQIILEKGDHSCWSAWNDSGGHHSSDQLLSFRSVFCRMGGSGITSQNQRAARQIGLWA